jgi:hypothetical protein
LSGNWISNVLGTTWDVETVENKPATLHSRWFSAPERGISYCRECVLTVPGKFFAETVLVYPQTAEIFPIFGSEYIRMARGSFGAVDFHPVQVENNRIPGDFGDFPPRTVPRSPHYDLDRHFSPVLWHKKHPDDFYGEFEEVADTRLTRYLAVLDRYRSNKPPDPDNFAAFDTYMAVHDPAHGILKSYFGAEFANDYIRRFLFPHCGRNVELGHVQRNKTPGSGLVPVVGPEPTDPGATGQ